MINYVRIIARALNISNVVGEERPVFTTELVKISCFLVIQYNIMILQHYDIIIVSL